MENSLIDQGFDLMLFGMGTVFIFLTLLIFVTTLMSKVILRWFPEKIVEAPAAKKKSSLTNGLATNSVSADKLKILQTAIDQHRNRN